MSIKHAEFITATIAGTAISGSLSPLLTLSGDVDTVFVMNSCDEDVVIQLTDSTSTEVTLPARTSFAFDGRPNKKRFRAGTIQIKYASAAVTSGRFTLVVVK